MSTVVREVGGKGGGVATPLFSLHSDMLISKLAMVFGESVLNRVYNCMRTHLS